MTSVSPDPLSVIAADTPRFSSEAAVDTAWKYFGLRVSAAELVSERDQNFHLRTDDGRQFVLKIANAAEDPLVTDFQIQALLYIEGRNTNVVTPKIVRTRDGRDHVELRSSHGPHVARLVTYLAGVPLAGHPLSVELSRSMGVYSANLGRALAGFHHPGANQCLLWDMRQAAYVRGLLDYIPNDLTRAEVERCVDEFDRSVAPAFPALRTQVIHNDLNPENVLLDPDDRSSVAGVIDFGDMLQSPLAVDVAVAASYMRAFEGHPLSFIAPFVGAYHSVTPLERREIDLLFDLILLRLSITISILHWRIATRGPDDPYLTSSSTAESTAEKFLLRLREVPRTHARDTFRQVCASIDVQYSS